MGWKPFVAKPLYGFVPADKIVDVCRAVGYLFRDHGDRYIRMYARLKFVVHRLGIERCRELVNEYLDKDGVDRSGFESRTGRRLRSGRARSAFVRTASRSAPTGFAIQQIKIPKGELSERASGTHRRTCGNVRRQARLQHESAESGTARRRSAAAARVEAGDRIARLRDGRFLRPKRRGHLRGHDLLPAGREHHAFAFRQAASARPRQEIRGDPRQSHREHHRLPELVLAVSHCRHRFSRAANSRDGRLDAKAIK